MFIKLSSCSRAILSGVACGCRVITNELKMVTKTEKDDSANHSAASNLCNTFERPRSTYLNCSERFLIGNRTFEKQYAPFYNARLTMCEDTIKEKVEDKWGHLNLPVKKLCDILVEEQVIVIGTLCKQMELRPSILKEISEEHHLIPQAVTDRFISDDDYLILEDDVQRIRLSGKIDPQGLVTGIIIAVLGSEQEDGRFTVEDTCYMSIPSPFPLPLFENDSYVMLVSGLGLGIPDAMFPLQLLVDYTTGLLGDEDDQMKASQISRVIIAGNSISPNTKDKEFTHKAKYLTRKTKAGTVEGIKLLDDFLTMLTVSVNVDVMPGEFDPSNHLMPQQPLHPCMFPKASRYSTFHSVPNPYDAQIDGVRFLGTSGQNISDIMSYSKFGEPCEVMEKTLEWGHLSPTAPDTLNCYPYVNEDPFIVSNTPHVYFAGNMPKMDSRKYSCGKNVVTVVSIPVFSEAYTVALVNLRTMEVEPFVFSGISKL